MSNSQLGFTTYFTGQVRGLTSEPKQSNDQQKKWVEHNLCIEGDDFKTVKFRIKRDDVDRNVMDELKKYVGKFVTINASSSHRVWNGSLYTDHYYNGEIKIVSLPDQQRS